ncbi:Rab2b [Giardia muris]|uniref:Rab2b n=1 Tax=Giardia muris TaxID=5742 RepID=A0A4Z1T1J0_GIAMU|nr:Rab2b [Giardia muris]|eukprot:TNJ26807.1 Rab2b [Giardia muris]
MPELAHHFTFKTILIGNSAVGKSCLVMRYVEKKFEPLHDVTIGVEYCNKTITLETEGGEERMVKLQIWDTAGQEQFRAITRSYYRGAAGVLLVYDVTNRESFDALTQWLTDLSTSTGVDMKTNASMVVALVGNKADLHEKRQVTTEEAETFAKEHHLLFTETSAKQDENVTQCFDTLAREILRRVDDGTLDWRNTDCGIKLGPAGGANGSGASSRGTQGGGLQSLLNRCPCA